MPHGSGSGIFAWPHTYAQLSLFLKNDRSRHPTVRGSSPIAGEVCDEGRSDLSYESYGTQYPTDRSIASPPSDNPRTNGTILRSRRPAYVSISSREHSFYQARGRGSDGVLVGLLDAVDALQRLRNSGEGNPPTAQDAQVSDQPTDMESRVPPNALIVQDVDGPMAAQHSLNSAANRRSRGSFSEVNDAPLDARAPHLSTDLHSCADTGDAAAGAPDYPLDDNTAPANNSTHEGAVPPPVDTRAPPAPPLRRVRARGVFIIGNGAPIRIDEVIEVHLRDGVDGQVDFVI